MNLTLRNEALAYFEVSSDTEKSLTLLIALYKLGVKLDHLNYNLQDLIVVLKRLEK